MIVARARFPRGSRASASRCSRLIALEHGRRQLPGAARRRRARALGGAHRRRCGRRGQRARRRAAGARAARDRARSRSAPRSPPPARPTRTCSAIRSSRPTSSASRAAARWARSPASSSRCPIAAIQGLAFAGGLAAVGLVLAIGAWVRGHDRVLTLVLTGVVVGSLFGAGIAFVEVRGRSVQPACPRSRSGCWAASPACCRRTSPTRCR